MVLFSLLNQMLKLISIASCLYYDDQLYNNLKRKVYVGMRLVELYRPFLFFKAM